MSSTCSVYGAVCEPAFVPFPVLNKLHAAKSSATKIASGFMRRVLTYIVASIDSSACSVTQKLYRAKIVPPGTIFATKIVPPGTILVAKSVPALPNVHRVVRMDR